MAKKPGEATCTVAGRLVRVRHATPSDTVFLKEMAGRCRLDISEAEYTRFVVADDGGKLVGFSCLSEAGGGELLRVFVEKGLKGVPELMVKHTLEV
jgi:hypothetical protein